MQIQRQRGFTLMELMIAIAIIFIVISVGLPALQAARIHANEVAVVKMISTIHTAQAQYQSQTGKMAVALPELSKLMSQKLAGGNHSGYTFVLQGTSDGYLITATPEKPGWTGNSTFTSDQTLVVRDRTGNDIAH